LIVMILWIWWGEEIALAIVTTDAFLRWAKWFRKA
jgi:hypothetical protein